MYKIIIHAELINEETGAVMCDQPTTWNGMDHDQMLALEESYAKWLASLPSTIGAMSLPPAKPARR